MKNIFLLIVALFAGRAFALVNSTEVSDEQFAADFPWMVVVEHPITGGICGGVLIAPDWVLSAAHCSSKRKQILVGHADRTEARRIKVVRSIRHPQFNKNDLQFDVGLMQLAEPVDMQLAPVAPDDVGRTLLFPGRAAELAGWGKIENHRTAVERLRTGQVKLSQLTLDGTRIIYNYKGGGPCGLDSGGPMLMNTMDGRRYLVGVASATAGELCNTNGGTAVYTNLITVRSFIMKHVESFY